MGSYSYGWQWFLLWRVSFLGDKALGVPQGLLSLFLGRPLAHPHPDTVLTIVDDEGVLPEARSHKGELRR